jgi:hypothetical protein
VSLLLLIACSANAAVKLILPLERTAYQTNEWIDVSVHRSDAKALPAGELTLTLTGEDGSSVAATFAVGAADPRSGTAQSTEHLHLNGWLLRPGKYKLEVAVDGAKEETAIEVCSHLRQSSFRLVNWGRAKGKEQLIEGENSLGFNTFYGFHGKDVESNLIRAGVDQFANCVMSGGHQMDLRMECDWSDPYVLHGGTSRVVRQAMIDRLRPNVPGVHFYDEPGLTWHKHPETGEFTPHGVPAQVRSYLAAFDQAPLSYQKIDPKNPEHVALWKQWAYWKLSLMDAAWKDAQFGVSQVRDDFLSVTQSQYGFSAFTDGYYFNVVRSLPVTSGHGGYHDFGPGFFNPSYFLELSRARDYWKDNWYLPTWYGNTTADQFRLEQYLSFQTGIQGMISPPDLEPAINAVGRQGIVESNQLMKRLGPIFTTMRPTRPPVALLYSLSQAVHTQTENRNLNYLHESPHGKNLPLTYLAGKLIQQQFLTIVEEDILDGTALDDHKVIVLSTIDYLDPKVVSALEGFIKNGGAVLMTGDSTVSIKGAIKLSAAGKMPDQEKIDQLVKEKKYNDLGPFTTTAKYVEGASLLARSIKAELDRLGVKPAAECEVPTIVITRQAAGDVEYIFAVNATPDETDKKDPRNAVKAVEATLAFPDDGRPIHEVTSGAPAAKTEKKEGKVRLTYRFGPGQMRVFARTAAPADAKTSVKISTPVVSRELVLEKEPIAVEIAATLLAGDRVVSGSVPLHVLVVDPLGALRHELYRATKLGQFSVRLPLAANDPPGEWKVVVRELLTGSESVAAFKYAPPANARAIAGTTQRAVFAVNDRENAFRFGRNHQDVTIVRGTSSFEEAAADRLTKALLPWGIRCKTMDLTEAAKPRKLTEEEAKTWCGLVYAGTGQIKPGDKNAPELVGFAVQGPVILLGNPEDNPIIKFLATQNFLPFTPTADVMPGRGRGMLAWQRDGVGYGQESITLIAYDEVGMKEAAGSFYQAVAGQDPLTKWALPNSDSITPAKIAPGTYPAAKVIQTYHLPDRVLAIGTEGAGLRALTHDGSLSAVPTTGSAKTVSIVKPEDLERVQKELLANAKPAPEETLKKLARPDRLLKLSAADGDLAAIAYWGGTLRIGDKAGTVKFEQQLPQDVTALTWMGAGKLAAGLADGRVLVLEMK